MPGVTAPVTLFLHALPILQFFNARLQFTVQTAARFGSFLPAYSYGSVPFRSRKNKSYGSVEQVQNIVVRFGSDGTEQNRAGPYRNKTLTVILYCLTLVSKGNFAIRNRGSSGAGTITVRSTLDRTCNAFAVRIGNLSNSGNSYGPVRFHSIPRNRAKPKRGPVNSLDIQSLALQCAINSVPWYNKRQHIWMRRYLTPIYQVH